MIDLSAIWSWTRRSLIIVLLALWLFEMRQSRMLLRIAETNSETAGACVVSYRDSAAALTAAVDAFLGRTPPRQIRGAGL
jgi:hypothetical protein